MNGEVGSKIYERPYHHEICELLKEAHVLTMTKVEVDNIYTFRDSKET